MVYLTIDAVAREEIRDLALRERQHALSTREWKHRLRGYGFDLRTTDDGHVIVTKLGGSDICELPADQAVATLH